MADRLDIGKKIIRNSESQIAAMLNLENSEMLIREQTLADLNDPVDSTSRTSRL
jgi:hypothetical protein